MSFEKPGAHLCQAALFLFLALVISAPCEGKTKRRAHSAGPGHYFVPPPPPYTPSILPEQRGYGQQQAVSADADTEESKPVNPYSKYIFTRNQNDMPRVVQPNPYVSYYHKS